MHRGHPARAGARPIGARRDPRARRHRLGVRQLGAQQRRSQPYHPRQGTAPDRVLLLRASRGRLPHRVDLLAPPLQRRDRDRAGTAPRTESHPGAGRAIAREAAVVARERARVVLERPVRSRPEPAAHQLPGSLAARDPRTGRRRAPAPDRAAIPGRSEEHRPHAGSVPPTTTTRPTPARTAPTTAGADATRTLRTTNDCNRGRSP
jgi:hypothetical protein